VVVKDAIVDTDDDRWFTYYNATGALVFSTYVSSAVFCHTDTHTVQVRYTSQYSEVDGRLFIEPDTESWQLQEGYYLTAQETYSNNSVWLQLSKNNKLVDEGLFYNSFDLQNDTTGHTIVSGTISGYNHSYDFVQLSSVTQYSEATGTVLATYPSATLYASWSFKHDKTLVTTTYSVGQGAPDLATKNHFYDAYRRNGRTTVLGIPTTEVHRAWGYLVQDFQGASGYAGGIILYNPYKNYAYYIHGAIWERYYNLGGPMATTDLKFELGPPVSDIEPYIRTQPPEVSSHGTQFRYQNFEGGALEHNVDAGEVFEIHGAIFAKWCELGYASGELGLVTSDEREAAQSPIGTDGRVSDFEGGHIHWHRTGGHGGESYETHGAIDAVYCAEGGSGGDLGFPVSDEYVNPSEYPQSDFEGGYITTTDGVVYEVFEYADKTPPTLVIGTPEDGEEAGSYIVEVSGVASDESGIYGVRIKVNGETAAELINSNLGAWNTNVMLPYGENEISVTACDNYFNTATEIITVYYYPDFSFVQITDVHIGWDPVSEFELHKDSDELVKEYDESRKKFTSTLQSISDLDRNPAFVLVTGDDVEYNRPVFFSGFKSDIHSFTTYNNIPFYFIPGNHDRRTGLTGDDNLATYHEYIETPGPDITQFGPDDFTFEYGGYLFIGLDSGKDYNYMSGSPSSVEPFFLPVDFSPEGSGLSTPQLDALKDLDVGTPKIIVTTHVLEASRNQPPL
jgi:hypothetical protein